MSALSKPDDLKAIAQFLFAGSALVLAIAVIFALRSFLRSRGLNGDSDWKSLIKSLTQYYAEHGFVFNVLLLVSAFFFTLYSSINLWGHPKPTRLFSLEDFSLAIFAGVSSALLILVLTDYAGKRFLENYLVPRVQAAAGGSLEASMTFVKTGLCAFPSVTEGKKPARLEFGQYLSTGDAVLVMSSSGIRWLLRDGYDIKAGDAQYGSELDYLRNKPITLKVLIHSPFLNALAIYEYATGTSWSSDRIDAMLKLLQNYDMPHSRHSAIQVLDEQLRFRETVDYIDQPDNVANGFALEVRVTSRHMLSEFFVISGHNQKRAYAAYPMLVKKDLESIAVHVYRPTAPERDLVSEVFEKEFYALWADAMKFRDYIETYAPDILKVIHKDELEKHGVPKRSGAGG